MAQANVVIPICNRAAYLARAVDGVLSQTDREFEVIVVDDGSGDGTEGIVETEGEQEPYVFQHNAGPGAARNHGIYPIPALRPTRYPRGGCRRHR